MAWSRLSALVAGICAVASPAWAQLPAVRCERPPVSAPRPAGGEAASQHEPTVADYEEVLRREPRTAQDYFNHGVLHERLGQYASAIRDYTGAIGLDPCFAGAYERRGAALASLKQFQRALVELDEAVRIDPNSPSVFVNRAAVFSATGQHERAIGDLGEAIALDPRDALAANEAAWLLATASQADLRDGRKAVELARLACEMTAWKESGYLDTYAAALAEAGRFEEAAKWQETALGFAGFERAQGAKARERLRGYREGKPFRAP